MNIQWKTGKPKKSGRYTVIKRFSAGFIGACIAINYSEKFKKWNANDLENEAKYACPDDLVVAWAECIEDALLKDFRENCGEFAWHTGKPKKDNSYTVVTRYGIIDSLDYSTKFKKWNASETCDKYAFTDETVLAWNDEIIEALCESWKEANNA